jgi:hypothetical protein
LIPRLPILGDLRLGRRLGWVIAVLIVLVIAIVAYNARAIAQQRGSALVVYAAARQRARRGARRCSPTPRVRRSGGGWRCGSTSSTGTATRC